MHDKNNNLIPPEDPFLMDEPPLLEENPEQLPSLALENLSAPEVASLRNPSPETESAAVPAPKADTIPAWEQTVFEEADSAPESISELIPELADLPGNVLEDVLKDPDASGASAEEPQAPVTPAAPEEDLSETQELSPMELAMATEHTQELPTEPEAPDDFQAAYEAAAKISPEAAAAPPQRIRTQIKGRPKRKKGYGFFGIPHLLATVVWLAIIVIIGTSLGRMIWVCAADVLAFGRESQKVTITITANDTIEDISNKLHEAGLVRYPGLFRLYADIAVDEGDIIPGSFEMDTLYDYHALVVQMGPASSNRSVVEDVLIPEGLNCRQIFELLEEYEICTVEELEAYAAGGELADYWFLEGVQRGDRYCLEGFLFPDTYDFYKNSTPREALGKLLSGFNYRFTEEVFSKLPALNERLSGMMRSKGCSEEYIAEHQLTLRDLLTVASLIEEETASTKENPVIASVIFNRLTEDQLYERYLNIDAALIYATGDSSKIDTGMDHPYNTYLNPGLTPGPISNPGLSSILAALEFEDTSYYYYVLNPETGVHQFSKTLEEHENWIAKFYPSEE